MKRVLPRVGGLISKKPMRPYRYLSRLNRGFFNNWDAGGWVKGSRLQG